MRSLSVSLLALGQAANPVNQILKMLDDLGAKVTTVGEEAAKEYDTFSLFCRDNSKKLQYALDTTAERLENNNAVIEKAGSDISSADAEIAQLSEGVASSEAEIKKGDALRKDQHAAFVSEQKELQDTISALTRAHGVLKSKSFVQQPNTIDTILSSLESILSASSVQIEGKDQLTAMLQAREDSEGTGAPEAAAYENHSGGILDVLADMLDKAEDQLSSVRKNEMENKHAWEMTKQGLSDQISTSTKDLDDTKKAKATAEEELAKAQGQVAELNTEKKNDNKSLADLKHECMARATEYETAVKEREAELKALSDAKQIIAEATGAATNREYGADSFLQVSQHNEADEKVASILRHVGLTQLASRVAMGGPFDKIKGMIGDMISKLQNEAEKEASAKEFCDTETAKANAQKDKMSTRVEDLSTRQDKTTSAIASLKEQVARAQKELAEISNAQQEMDTMRQEENKAYKEAKADYEKGLTGLQQALSVLRDYYAKDDASFVQLSKSTDAANGIISMLEVAETDFAKSLAEGQAAEEEAVAAYDKTTNDNKVRTAGLTAEVKAKTNGIKATENTLAEIAEDKDTAGTELSSVLESLDKLNDQCVAKPEPYEERKKRRENEISGLKEALEILETEAGTAFLAVRRHY